MLDFNESVANRNRINLSNIFKGQKKNLRGFRLQLLISANSCSNNQND